MNTITRSEFLKRMGVCAAGMAGAPYMLGLKDVFGASAGGKRPNFIFIFCDDMGWGDLPCYGHRNVIAHGGWTVRGELKMPNLDRMAREGTLFTQFYVASGVCSPSRAAVMTGMFPGRVGFHDYLAGPELNKERGMPDYLDPAIPTVTRLLKESGYATGHFGKWHLWHLGKGKEWPSDGEERELTPERYGIDCFDGCRKGPDGRVRSTETIIDETISFIEAHKSSPFFINAWLYDPHSPLHPTEEQMKPYEDLSPGWGDRKGAFQVYYAVLSDIDRHVGRLLDKLDEMGLSENTVVIFSSDNGPEIGLIPFTSHYAGVNSAGPFRGLKRSLYEGGVREPFIVRWLGKIPAGKVDNATVIDGVDFLPTICSLAGVDNPAGTDIDGEDMSASFLGKPQDRTKPLMWENRFPVYGHVVHKSPMLAIRDGKWKLLMNPDNSRIELYDIPSDPTELDNLADQYPEVVKKLSDRLLKWQATLPKGPVNKDAGSNAYPWPKGK